MLQKKIQIWHHFDEEGSSIRSVLRWEVTLRWEVSFDEKCPSMRSNPSMRRFPSWALDRSSRGHFCGRPLPRPLVTPWPHIHNPMTSLPLELALHRLHKWVDHQSHLDMRHSHLIHIRHISYCHSKTRFRVELPCKWHHQKFSNQPLVMLLHRVFQFLSRPNQLSSILYLLEYVVLLKMAVKYTQ